MSESHEGRYSRAFRVAEYATFVVFAALMAPLVWQVARHAPTHPIAIASGVLLGLISMDFLSGAFHWAGDTWGSVTWPVIGPTVLRTFREHHVDPLAITRHDFVEVNATSCMVSFPWLLYGLFAHATPFGQAYTAAIGLGAVMTNQIHAWAHRAQNPWWIRALQRTRLILGPAGHARHHVAPYVDHYCITTGWLNAPFAHLRVWRGLERVVTWLTGAEPRAEDRRAAEAVEAAHKMARG